MPRAFIEIHASAGKLYLKLCPIVEISPTAPCPSALEQRPRVVLNHSQNRCQSDMDKFTLARLMGHSSPRVAERCYIHVTEPHVMTGFERFLNYHAGNRSDFREPVCGLLPDCRPNARSPKPTLYALQGLGSGRRGFSWQSLNFALVHRLENGQRRVR